MPSALGLVAPCVGPSSVAIDITAAAGSAALARDLAGDATMPDVALPAAYLPPLLGRKLSVATPDHQQDLAVDPDTYHILHTRSYNL